MDSSPVLRLQSQNKIRSDFMRMKNESNKMGVHPKPSKLQVTPHLSDQNTENQDPGNSQMGRKAAARPGVSRLPVLAKSLHLQTPSDFSQSHCKWEENPLSGKAKKKRPCTRPIPFNLSQPKSSRMASEYQNTPTLSQTKTGTQAPQHEKKLCSTLLKPHTSKTSSAKHPTTVNCKVDSSKGAAKSDKKSPENEPQLSGQPAHATIFKTSVASSQPLSGVSKNAAHKDHGTTSSVQFALSTETCLDNMNLLSLKDLTKSSQATKSTLLNTQDSFSKFSTDKTEIFQPDHTALLSILRNEGVSVTTSGSASPQSRTYNYVPQRVSVMKGRQKAGTTSGSVKSAQFSPDLAALQSILQNEGVKAAGSGGATPLNPLRPSGRGTSVYTAQRVPVRRNQTEGGPLALALKETPAKKWTPQRVPDTRHQPMSAMKWHMSTQQSPFSSTPGLRSCKTNLQPHQEEIVQRLFSDQDDQHGTNVMEKDPETEADQPPVQKNKPYCEGKVETSEAPQNNEDEVEEEEEEEKKERNLGEQPFFQAPHRESVIFFSTGKQLLRAPRFEKQESASSQEQRDIVLTAQMKMLPLQEEKSSISEQTNQSFPAAQSLHRDLTVKRACSKSPVVAMLRKRLPQLEELRMDEEVATYTSVTVPAAPGFGPPRPRCGNPLASILHFEEFSRFVPIGFGPSSSPQH